MGRTLFGPGFRENKGFRSRTKSGQGSEQQKQLGVMLATRREHVNGYED